MNQDLHNAFDEHREALTAFIRKRVPDLHMADDLLHDLYLKLQAQKPESVIQYPKAYLYRMANNLIIDALRKHARIRSMAEPQTDEPSHSMSPENHLEHQQQLNIVTQAINELPEKTREVFRLQRIQQIEKRAVASQLGISVNMVEKHLRRAVQYCRDKLNKLEN